MKNAMYPKSKRRLLLGYIVYAHFEHLDSSYYFSVFF